MRLTSPHPKGGKGHDDKATDLWDAGRSVRLVPRLSPRWPYDMCSSPPLAQSYLFDKFRTAVEKAGGTLQWETLPAPQRRKRQRRSA
jgi:hypothetical protein